MKMDSLEDDAGSVSDDGGFEWAEKIILCWDLSTSEEARERMIFESERHHVDLYLRAVDEIQRWIPSSGETADVKATLAMQLAIARLEDEFRNILVSRSSSLGAESIFRETSSCTSDRTEMEEDGISARRCRGEEEVHEKEEEEEESVVHRLSVSSSSRLSGLSSYGSTGSISEHDLIPPEAVTDLRSIAKRMVAAGYLRECMQVYASVRKSFLEASFRRLGVEKLSVGDVQRLEWDALEGKIRRWIRAAKVCVRVVFVNEKKLCEQVLDGIGTAIDEACFMETVKGAANQLFNFAEAISVSRRSPEKLFKILDLHDALMDLLPDIESVFNSKSSDSIRVQAAEIISRLAEAARGTLSEFENAVLREPSLVPVPGGTIHPLTRYVMNYISLISDYKQTLVELIMSKPSSGSRFSSDPKTPDMDPTELGGKTPLAVHLTWIVAILQFNLDEKSKHYRDVSLRHLFIMNNAHYIVQKIKGSPELREMIGDDKLRALTRKFRQAAANYRRATWVQVLHCLRDEGLHSSGSFFSGVSKSTLRERFKSLNAMFEEVHRTQATWVVPDAQLREELQISIAEVLIPAYRSFLGRFRTHIECGKHPENYIKYSVEDLEMAVLDFFEGLQPRRRSL